MKRPYDSGRIYEKRGAFYGRWRTLDGRYVNRRLGKVRERGSHEGISRREAERALRKLMETETQPRPAVDLTPHMVDEVADQLRDRLAVQGARLSYRQNCAAMQRIHISPTIGSGGSRVSSGRMSSGSRGRCSRAEQLPRRCAT